MKSLPVGKMARVAGVTVESGRVRAYVTVTGAMLVRVGDRGGETRLFDLPKREMDDVRALFEVIGAQMGNLEAVANAAKTVE